MNIQVGLIGLLDGALIELMLFSTHFRSKVFLFINVLLRTLLWLSAEAALQLLINNKGVFRASLAT